MMQRSHLFSCTLCSAMLPAAASAANFQNSLLPAGPQSAHIHDLWWLTVAICTFVFTAIVAALLLALWRTPRAQALDAAGQHAPAPVEHAARRRVIVAISASIALLLLLIVASFFTDRALASLDASNPVEIEVTGNQWWWEIRYTDKADPSRSFTTANELHIPVGQPIAVTLKSSDVIHSFWLPNLHGKKDMIPGRRTTLNLRADEPGVYRGQCAEFCGYQHAHMAFLVTAESAADFEAWSERQRQPAAAPTDADASHGREIFLSTTCIMCHAIQGTSASARRGPDLTHVASRSTLAAGALANNADNLESWIRDPQQHKPGATMPGHILPREDLHALATYLGGLK